MVRFGEAHASVMNIAEAVVIVEVQGDYILTEIEIGGFYLVLWLKVDWNRNLPLL
jgi:hypothetical protein